MADISKIQLSSQTLNIKDETARAAIENLPKYLRYIGTLGIEGSTQTLPDPSINTVGHVYQVVSNGTYSGLSCKEGDLVVGITPAVSTYGWAIMSKNVWGSIQGTLSNQTDLQAALNAKQNILAAQTPYSNKGSGTKVAQISTNNLGQVTNITEVDITKTTLADLGITATASEINMLDGLNANTNELNILAGATLTTQQLNYVDGVTSSIQTQLNGKEPADATILKESEVVDNVSTISTNLPLSAKQGKLLNDRIDSLSMVGRFLSIWNAKTGLPTSEPSTIPYTYHTGDYYRVGVVDMIAPFINYRPYGSQYTGVASTFQWEEDLNIGDVFYYDGSQWILQASGSGGKVQDVQVNGTTIISEGIANITALNSPELPASKITNGVFDVARIPDITLSKVSDVTATASEVNVLDGITATTAELNILDGLTATTTELNYVEGVTSSIQTQLDSKQASLPEVTNDRYLHTNSSTGALEWSEVVQGGVTSITANNGLTGSATTGDITIGMTNPMYYDSIASSIPVPINADTLQSHPANYFQSALTVNPASPTTPLTSIGINGTNYSLGSVADVKVNGTSVVQNRIANISMMTYEEV